jgi:integrase
MKTQSKSTIQEPKTKKRNTKFKNPNNQKTATKYLEHLMLGNAINGKNRKPIKERSAKKTWMFLRKLELWFGNKDFKDITQADVDSLRMRLSNDKIRKLDGTPFSKASKKDIEYKCLRLLLLYLGKTESAMFMNQYNEQRETPALTKDEVNKMIDSSNLRDKVIISVLFDGGLRIGEFMNLTFNDLFNDERQSKGYFKIRIRISKTKPRTIGLYQTLTTQIIDRWLDANKDKIGTDQPLVKLSYSHLCMALKRTGTKVLKKHVYPHLLRHSSATYYCHQLNQYQLCKRYGWSMSSSMPALYIDAQGINEEELGQKVKEAESQNFIQEINKLKEQMTLVKERETTMRADVDREVSKKIKELMDEWASKQKAKA